MDWRQAKDKSEKCCFGNSYDHHTFMFRVIRHITCSFKKISTSHIEGIMSYCPNSLVFTFLEVRTFPHLQCDWYLIVIFNTCIFLLSNTSFWSIQNATAVIELNLPTLSFPWGLCALFRLPFFFFFFGSTGVWTQGLTHAC
jgi:hypothetical protein